MEQERQSKINNLIERLKGLTVYNYEFLDANVRHLAKEFAKEDLLNDDITQIVDDEGLFNEGYGEAFNDLYDDYYEEIYEGLAIMTPYEKLRDDKQREVANEIYEFLEKEDNKVCPNCGEDNTRPLPEDCGYPADYCDYPGNGDMVCDTCELKVNLKTK